MSQLVRKLSIWRQTSSHGHWLSARPAHCRPIDKWPRPLEVHHVCHPQSFSLLKASGVTMRASLVAGQHEIDTVTECHTLPKHQTATYIYIYIYLKCNHALAGKHLQKCLPNIQPILSLSLSPYFCLIFSPNLSEHFSMRFGWRPHWSHIAFQPPLFKNAKEQAKTYQGSQPGQEILQCFFIALFFKWPKKICHSTWQLLFGKLWENKTVNMESSWELRGGDDAKNLQWGTGWGQTNVELSR